MNTEETEKQRRKRKAAAGWGLAWWAAWAGLLLAIAAVIMSAIALTRGECTPCRNGLNGVNGTCVGLCPINCSSYCNNSGSGGNTTGLLDFADFYALMPGDNAATIAVGADVLFPQPGPAKAATGITALNTFQFQIAQPGIYDVSFFVSVSEPGQLELTLNGVPLADSVTGRATGTSLITAAVLVTIGAPNTLLTVRNPAGNGAALTITPIAGGASSVSAHLKILRLS